MPADGHSLADSEAYETLHGGLSRYGASAGSARSTRTIRMKCGFLEGVSENVSRIGGGRLNPGPHPSPTLRALDQRQMRRHLFSLSSNSSSMSQSRRTASRSALRSAIATPLPLPGLGQERRRRPELLWPQTERLPHRRKRRFGQVLPHPIHHRPSPQLFDQQPLSST